MCVNDSDYNDKNRKVAVIENDYNGKEGENDNQNHCVRVVVLLERIIGVVKLSFAVM